MQLKADLIQNKILSDQSIWYANYFAHQCSERWMCKLVLCAYIRFMSENPLAKDNHNSFSSMTVIIILTGINLTYCSFAFISFGTLKFLSMWNNVTWRICGVQNERWSERKWERTEYDAHKFDLFFPISFILSLFFKVHVCVCDIHRFHIRIIWKCCSNSYIKRHIRSSGGTTRAGKKMPKNTLESLYFLCSVLVVVFCVWKYNTIHKYPFR